MSMAFDYDTKYVKDTTIPYVDTLSRLRYITSESEKGGGKIWRYFLTLDWNWYFVDRQMSWEYLKVRSQYIVQDKKKKEKKVDRTLW